MLRRLVLILFLLPTLLIAAQNPWSLPDASHRGHGRPPSPDEVRREKELEKERVKHRYQDLRHDTDKLLGLATELKQQVDAAGEEKLSLDVIKKAEEIEKLAKSVKNKMKGD